MNQKHAISKSPPDAELQGRILLSEDEKNVRELLEEFLRNAGYVLTSVADGEAAWSELQRGAAYDAVITDRNMPALDGLELSKRIKRDQRFRNIPVVMITGATRQEEVTQGIKAGVYYYLAKPFEEEALLTIVKSALRDKRRTALFEQKLQSHRNALGSLSRGEFEVRTLNEAEDLALMLGSMFPRQELAVSGLYELLLNAIEHGNLGIGYEEKEQLIASSQWEAEIMRRLVLPEHIAKKVRVQFAQNNGQIEVMITDSGQGFDWTPFLEIEPSRATRGSGRGIARANLLSFDSLKFHGQGNSVHVLSKV